MEMKETIEESTLERLEKEIKAMNENKDEIKKHSAELENKFHDFAIGILDIDSDEVARVNSYLAEKIKRENEKAEEMYNGFMSKNNGYKIDTAIFDNE